MNLPPHEEFAVTVMELFLSGVVAFAALMWGAVQVVDQKTKIEEDKERF
jgi:hypothetical protein